MARDPKSTGLLDYIWTIYCNLMLVSDVFESRYKTVYPKKRLDQCDGGWSDGIGRIWFAAPLIEKTLAEREGTEAESHRAIGAILWNTAGSIFRKACELSDKVEGCKYQKRGGFYRVVFIDGSVKRYRPIRHPKPRT